MKKILIITYYWPPSGGSGVQRWLKFVKYLTRFNYHCIVYTPENPEIPAIDHSFDKDIPKENFTLIKTKIFEPYLFYKAFTGKSLKEKITVSFLNEKKQKSSFTEKFSKWIRGNFFIPDAKMCWIKPSIKFLTQYLSKNPTDIIISTGPPHSLHLIALGIKKKFPDIKWIADFRDPWTNIDFLDDLHLSSWAQKKHQQLEKKVLHSADKVIAISPTLTKELSESDNENTGNPSIIMSKIEWLSLKEHTNKFFTITNGFDPEDFAEIKTFSSSSHINHTNKPFTLTYAGLIPPNRNPVILWKAIRELLSENKLPSEFKVQLIGKTDASVLESIKENKIEHLIDKHDYLPHSEVLKMEANADALLLIINNAPNSKGILTGKLFEYLALQKPILAIGPKDGDASQIIQQTNAGIVVDYNNLSEMKNALIGLFNHTIPTPTDNTIQPYSREYLTKELIKIIEN